MAYKFQDKLRARASAFIESLMHADITGNILPDSFRDYTVKIAISIRGNEFGNASLYYSPNKNAFSLKVHELKDKSILAQLERCWHGEQQPKAAASKPSARGYELYVDGSYINGATGYGVAILKDGEVVAELCGPIEQALVDGTRQVAGELRAVEEALVWCKQNRVDEAAIYYDYYGVEKWATGAWKANQPLTQGYGKRVRESGIRIRWRKVYAHTGDRWNDRADALAKRGALSALKQGTPSSAAPSGDNALVAELLEKQERFLEFLMVKGIEAAFDRIYNDQFARLFILRNEKSVGMVDLYHTKRKPFSPYLHNFKDKALQAEIESYWQAFIAADKQ
jgi:ribonuclease HI